MISVALICWNHEKFVEESIRSVLQQRDVPMEIILIDNGSEDKSLSKASSALNKADCRVTVIANHVNEGIGRALNQALEVCIGDFFAPMSCDDVMVPDRLQLQLKEMIRHPDEVVGVAGLAPMIDERGVEIRRSLLDSPQNGLAFNGTLKHFRSSLLRGVVPKAPIVLLRTEKLRMAGGYHTNAVAEDYDLWLRLAFFHNLRMASISAPLTYYRQHRESVTASSPSRVIDSALYSLTKLGAANLSDAETALLKSRNSFLKSQKSWCDMLACIVNYRRFRGFAVANVFDRNLAGRRRLLSLSLLLLPSRLSRILMVRRFSALRV